MRGPAVEALSPPPSRTKPGRARRAAVLPEPQSEQGDCRPAALPEPERHGPCGVVPPASVRPAAAPEPEPFAALLLRVAQGASLRESCRALGLDEARFRAAVLADAGLAERFARARWCSADAQFDEIQELERRVLDGELEAATLRAVLDARKWRLARLRPAVYGDASAAPSAGAGEGGTDPAAAPLPDLSGLTPEQLLELTRLAFGVGKGEGASDGRARAAAPESPEDAGTATTPAPRAARKSRAGAKSCVGAKRRAADHAADAAPEDRHA